MELEEFANTTCKEIGAVSFGFSLDDEIKVGAETAYVGRFFCKMDVYDVYYLAQLKADLYSAVTVTNNFEVKRVK